MEKLQIKSGVKEIEITDENDNQKGVLKFNPSLIEFIERYQKLLIDFRKKSIEFEKYLDSISSDEEISVEEEEKLSKEAMGEVNGLYDFVDVEIDALFGEGSSAILFSKKRDTGEYDQFLNGIAPYIQGARAEKTDQYSARKGTSKKRNRQRK